MFKRLDFKLKEVYEIAHFLKTCFPEAKIKIKTKNNFIEIYFLTLVDLYKLEEIKLHLQKNLPHLKITYFHQKI